MRVLIKQNWGSGDARSWAFDDLERAQTFQRSFSGKLPLPALAYDDGSGWRTSAGILLRDIPGLIHGEDVHEQEWQRESARCRAWLAISSNSLGKC
jgi:hypothetical protein